MKSEIKYVKEIRIIKEKDEEGLMAIRARGVASVRRIVAPKLVPKDYTEAPGDGIYELDFTLGCNHEEFMDIDLEVEVVFRIRSLPAWVKGVKINAAENSDIELV
ncbi:MAG TPA: hypothetical protein PLW31_13835 [Bacteroidales bacterium]|jgi:hypothetical protein|nr:hypothetical protein [Bacteroidales bacterium]HNQ83520.1 hypothetical protein [Bacteroidales bacterium]HOX79108.1 hypothetical protein [Bacteroidales bacterium]HPI85417.1 hypothetical protein [Bacteroidales bacterium]HPM91821.1 hypothetical protein [Bacteroidales bacterium]